MTILKRVTPSRAGTAQSVSGNDWNQLYDLLNGVNLGTPASIFAQRVTDHVDIIPPTSEPASPSDTNAIRMYLDPATFRLQLKKPDGSKYGLVFTDQVNIYGAFDQLFKSGNIKIRNPANTFSAALALGAITADRTFTFPSIGADGTVTFLEGTQTLSGLKTFSAQTTHNIAAISGTETLATFKVSDDALSSLGIVNASGVDANFAANLVAKYLGSLNTLSALNVTAIIDPSQDTGTNPVITLTSKNNDGTKLANRRLLAINNFTTQVFSVDPGGINFHSQPVIGLNITGVQGLPITGHQTGGLIPDENLIGSGLMSGMVILRPDSDPSSIIVQPDLSQNTWNLVLTTPGATKQVGFYKNRAIAFANRNPRFRVLTYLVAPNQDDRFYIGWTDFGDQAMGQNDTPLDEITAGILLGFRTSDTNWMVFHSSGEGNAMQVFDTGIPRSSWAIKDFELKSVFTSNKWTVQVIHANIAAGDVLGTYDITTEIPQTQVPLYFHCVFQSQFTDAARQIILPGGGIEMEVGTIYGGTPT